MFIEPLDSLLCWVRETLNLLAEVLELLGSRLEVGNLVGEGRGGERRGGEGRGGEGRGGEGREGRGGESGAVSAFTATQCN